MSGKSADEWIDSFHDWVRGQDPRFHWLYRGQPARFTTLAPSQRDALSTRQIRLLADRLQVEIAEKLVFKPTLAPPEVWL